MKKIAFIFILAFVIGNFLTMTVGPVEASCSCPTSTLLVSPQSVQPGAPITFTFPGDRGMYIEDNTNGGLQQEAGHVDNTNGGSIHFQNGSNPWYIFHAGPTCGTYTWNHQSRPAGGCGTCYVSAQFNVCGGSNIQPVSNPTAQPTAVIQPTQYIPTPTDIPPTSTPVNRVITTKPIARPTSGSMFAIPTIEYANSTSQPREKIEVPITDKGRRAFMITVRTLIFSGKDFINSVFTKFLLETRF